MSVNMASTQPVWRPAHLHWPPGETDADADWALVGKHAMAYAGTWAINSSFPATETEGHIIHGPFVASVPRMAGSVQYREYFMHRRGGEAYLKIRVQAGDLRSEIWWRRVASFSGREDRIKEHRYVRMFGRWSGQTRATFFSHDTHAVINTKVAHPCVNQTGIKH